VVKTRGQTTDHLCPHHPIPAKLYPFVSEQFINCSSKIQQQFKMYWKSPRCQI